MNGFTKFIALSAFVLLSQGCGVGFAVMGGDTTVFENPVMGETRPKLVLISHEAPRVTSLELKKHWGEPDSIKLKDGVEYWKYNVGLRWYGIRFFISLIPLPLQVPVGHDSMTFEVKDGLVSRVIVKHDDAIYFALCGFYPDPHNISWLCSSKTLKQMKENGESMLVDYAGTSDDFKWIDEKPDKSSPESP